MTQYDFQSFFLSCIINSVPNYWQYVLDLLQINTKYRADICFIFPEMKYRYIFLFTTENLITFMVTTDLYFENRRGVNQFSYENESIYIEY